MSGAIQKAEVLSLDNQGGEVARWSGEQWDLVKRTVCPKGISNDEFLLFAEQCRASGFNPLLKEAFCVPRNVKVSKRGEPDKWVTNHVFQPSVDGMLARAARFPDFLRARCEAVFANDRCEISADEVMHSFNPCKPRGVLQGAWAKVERKGAPPTIQWLPAGSRSGNSAFWSADPGGMLAKCALAAALRKAYPATYAGIHAAEELQPEHAEPSRAEQVLQRLDGQAKATEPEKPELPPPSPGPVLAFGDLSGTPIKDLTRGQVQEALSYGAQKMADAATWAKLKEPLKKKVQDSMAALQAALDSMPPEPEPHEEPLPDATEDAQDLAEPGAGG